MSRFWAGRIARLLGGDLSVDDTPEPGATFVLRLPLRAADADRPEALSAAAAD